MVDINSFLLTILYILGAILLVVLIVLSIKLVNAVNKVDNIIKETETRLGKLDRMLNVVDVVTDSMALVSDKIVDGISGVVKKVFVINKRKEEYIDE